MKFRQLFTMFTRRSIHEIKPVPTNSQKLQNIMWQADKSYVRFAMGNYSMGNYHTHFS